MAGETVTKGFGPHEGRVVLQVETTRHHDGISLTVLRHSTLDRTFTNDRIGEARTYLRLLIDMARAGHPVWQIEAAAGVLTSTQAVFDDAERELVDSLKADMDADRAQRVAAYEREQAAVADIMATPYRRVRNTRTQVFRQPLNAVQTAAVRSHRNGVVHLGDGITRPTLVALADKGVGDLNYQPGLGRRKVVESLTLNGAGWAVANEITEAAA
jgi:hypothetical protein